MHTGFLEISARTEAGDKLDVRRRSWRARLPLPEPENRVSRRRAAWIAASCSPSTAVSQQPDPGLEQSRLPRPVAGSNSGSA